MFVLAIDTSSAAVSAAVVEVDDAGTARTMAQSITLDARAHGERLAPNIELCLQQAGVRVADVGAVVAGLGPGPFTGLRVGLVTAAVFAELRGIPVYGVCSLDGIAGVLDEPDLLVAGDARRREVYWARYHHGVRVEGPLVSTPAAVAEHLRGEGVSGMTGSGARLYADVLGLPLRSVDHPDPVALVQAAAGRITAGAESEILTPLYLRRPDAVEPGATKSVTG
ncbi:tRNA threonylcarbamoyl adenosine modification protein YeaZ [Jatrophihabitans sp. GAS493]|uniref:tRNA (adenosine(37)-N6)-threonylcarbamoyltransferase complex dimerization subunit type 1 TsaB n=1 Tax=Jatrophihabitans sp. GAS493 TaxID=1907575 RepID=UPI000BB9B2DE|nr:tRNA (adenosine(37)-N6)-threonylcarbamoyltransferase complex dimerization subunit type 1 TsaB [Jatrophihabitans sp. GAS493]SOD70391.1 tRNA threonylcarbamoyl adenosine modification protein YeaZ [Jatrophihabitans sp. GAS493]